MNHGDARVVPCLGTCGCGVGVALDQNHRGWPVGEERSRTVDHPADLSVSGLVADAVQGFRFGELRGFEETPEISASAHWQVCR